MDRELTESREPSMRLQLVCVLAAAGALRLWSLAWGWPYGLYGDEAYYMPNALRMAADRTLSPVYFQNSHLFTYLCLAEVAALYILGHLVGVFHDVRAFGAFVWSHGIVFLALARLMTAGLAVATVHQTYRLGQRLATPAVGLLAALLLSVSPLHVYYSKVAVNDICMALFVTLAINAAISFIDSRSRHSLIAAGFLTGLAAGAKYNGGFVLIVPLVTTVLMMRSPDGVRTKNGFLAALAELCSHVGWLFGAACLGFVVSNPFSLLDFASFRDGFVQTLALGQHPWPGQPALSVPLLMARSLSGGFGVAPSLLAVVGWLLWVFQSRRAAAFLLFSVLYLLYMGSQRLFFPRFLLPIYPVLAVLAGYAIYRVVNLVVGGRTIGTSRHLWRGVALATLTGAAIASPLWNTVRMNAVLHEDDTRVQIRAWLKDHVQPGTRLLADFDAAAALGASLQGPTNVLLTSANRNDLVRSWDCGRVQSENIQFVSVSSGLLYGIEEGYEHDRDRFMKCLEFAGRVVVTFTPLSEIGASKLNESSLAQPSDLFESLGYRTRGGPLIRLYQITAR